MITFDTNNQKLLPAQFQTARKKPVQIEFAIIDVEFEVKTLEGTMRGKPGDVLIRGVEGELYPCARGIFDKTYDYTTDEQVADYEERKAHNPNARLKV